MSYVEIWVGFLHAARGPLASVTVSPAADADFPAYYAHDGRAQSSFKHGAASTTGTYLINRGAAGLEAVDLLIIPATHTLTGSVTVEASTSGAFAGEQTTLATFTATAGVAIVQTLVSSTARYLLLSYPNATTPREIGEVFYTRKRQPSRGPATNWPRGRQPNYQRTQFFTGVTGGTVIGPRRWVYTLTWQHLDGTDFAIFSELDEACGANGERFFMQMPDSDAGLVLVEFASPFRWVQDAPDPRGMGSTYTATLDVIEAIG